MASLGAQSLSVLAGVLIMALGLTSRTAHAEVRVEGQIDSVRIEVRDASVRDVLEALSSTFHLRVEGSAALDRPVSGTYKGSLQQVVARLLTGRDYVATYSTGKVEIRILDAGTGGKSQAVAGRSAAPAVVHRDTAPVTASVDNGLMPIAAPQDAAPAFADKRLMPTVGQRDAAPTPAFLEKSLLMFVPR